MSWEKKGEDLEKKAETKAAKPTGLFSFMDNANRRQNDAARLYNEAAAQYKRGMAFGRAGDAHAKEGELYQATGDTTEAIGAFKSAATMFKQSGDTKKAIQWHVQLAEMYEEKNRTSQAAKVYAELSEMYMQLGTPQIEDAIQSRENQIRCYLILDQAMHEIEAKNKLADLCASLERYPKAIELYEAVAEPRNGRANNRANECYWKAMLCHMVHEAKTTNEIKQSAAHLTRYANLFPNFDKGVNRRSYVLLQKIFDAFAAESLEAFETALADHERSAG